MDFSKVIEALPGSLVPDLYFFAPELVLCIGIVSLLLLRLFSAFNRWHLGTVALIVTLLALAISWGQWSEGPAIGGQAQVGQKAQLPFTGLLVVDNFTIFLRLFLFGFVALVIWLSILTGIPDTEDSADFYALLLGATLGMSLMASANHLLMVFIAVEMASLPSYALAGFLKGKRQSSEASLKYVVYGGGASGIMLYGISLLAGKFGTAYLPDVSAGYAAVLQQSQLDPILLLGTLFVLIGIGFKLAAFPFHFWCPDVFEGAAAEVAAFLSVASKGAALALLGRFVFVLAGFNKPTPDPDMALRTANFLVPALAAFAALTATFGNLAAYMQTNLKRLLAYSTIAHAGYMMMGLATLRREGGSAVLFYLIGYLFMNLGAFAVVAFIRNQTGAEDLAGYRGLVQRSPLLTVTLAFFLFSLLGVPPLVGFAAKFQIFRVLYDAGRIYSTSAPNLSYTMYGLLVIGALNTVLSLFYYVNVLKVMILDKPVQAVDGQPLPRLLLPVGSAVYATLMAAAVFVLGILWDPLAGYSDKGVQGFKPEPPKISSRGA